MKMRVTLPPRDPDHLAGLALDGQTLEHRRIGRLGGGLRMRAAPPRPRPGPSTLQVQISAPPKPKLAAMPVVDMGKNFRRQLAEAEQRAAAARRQESAVDAGRRASEVAASWGRTFDRLGWSGAGKSN